MDALKLKALEFDMDTNKMMTWLKPITSAITMIMVASSSHAVMQSLDDQTLSQETGQAAFYTSYTPPSGTGTGATTSDFGFFTLGLNGNIALNANIDHLQLGCGGVNGAGCDIDIDNLGLSGISDGGTGLGHYAVGTARAATDAVLSNPFIQLAIKNPTSLSTRQLVGFNLGAQQAVGLLTTGTGNTNTPNGINSLSGYLHVQSTSAADTLTGTVATQSGYFDAGDPNNLITGKLNVVGGLVSANFKLISGGFYVPGFQNLNFSVAGPTVNGSRISALTVNPTVSLPTLDLGFNTPDNTCGTFANSNCNTIGGYAQPNLSPNTGTGTGPYPYGTGTGASASGGIFYITNPATNIVGTQGGPATAIVTSCGGLQIGCTVGKTYGTDMYGQVTGLQAAVSFTQPLGYIHSLSINSPLSLSLQSQNILWPGSPTADVAQTGWWLSASDPVYLGNLVPTNPVSLCPGGTGGPANQCVYPQIAKQITANLASNPPNSNDLGTLLGGGTLGVAIGSVALTPLSLALVNGVQLSGQSFLPNCYGGLKFC